MPDARGFKAAGRWYLIAALVAIVDQITKQWVVAGFDYGEALPVTDFFNLVLVHNYGAAFSFLSDAGGWQRWFFSALALTVSAVLGGAVGNLFDRMLLGYVIDFLDFHWGNRHWPAFNFADSAICVGAGLLIWDSLFGSHGKGAKTETE